MNYPASREMVRAIRHDRKRIADLLGDYPALSPAETQEILEFLRSGTHLDVGLLTSNEEIRPKLDAFMDEHKSHFKLRWIDAARLVVAIAALLAVLAIAWEALA
jgi:hypothetical protein